MQICVSSRCGDGRRDVYEACDDGNNKSGDGCPVDCSAPCGDGVLDPGEACDDGNTQGGDGCSSDCFSTERCGNGVLDSSQGELCDDGNLRDGDGCASTCILEQPRWDSYDALPRARAGHALAFDAARGRVLMFGGVERSESGQSVLLSDTWVSDGTHWLEREPVARPPARQGHAMAYDARRGKVVLFGGCALLDGMQCKAILRDTWEWDGGTWIRREPATLPPARFGHALAYDAVRHKIVMFGGSSGEAPNAMPLGDTWEWDGVNWTRRIWLGSPPSRSWHAMAYDAGRGVVVMFGGQGRDGLMLDTWEWDGRSWQASSPRRSPPARAGHGLIYDAKQKAIVLVAGCLRVSNLLAGCSSRANDVWKWNGADWVDSTAGPRPAPRGLFGLTYDSERQTSVLFGGESDQGFMDDHWELAGPVWRELPRDVAPESVVAAAYDVRRAKVVVFGGRSGDETWEWDGAWAKKIPTTTPTPRVQHSLVYDATSGRVLLFGGLSLAGALADTWAWNGEDWSRLSPNSSPPPRAGHGLAYDSLRRRVVLFGGNDGSRELDDTWEWNGAEWERMGADAATKPRARQRHAMAYDTSRRRIVLFGGSAATVPLGDMWYWDGQAWVELMPAMAPPPQFDAVLAYDALRKVLVLYGGVSPESDLPIQETWEWNGSEWRAQTSSTLPGIRRGRAMVFDAVRRGLVLFGERDDELAKAWRFGFESSAPAESCRSGFDGDRDGLSGCDDPDCAGLCDPLCSTLLVCDFGRSRCGDGRCSDLEDVRSCPDDCVLGTPPVCGDFHCDPGESCAACASDCGCP